MRSAPLIVAKDPGAVWREAERRRDNLQALVRWIAKNGPLPKEAR